MKLKSLVVGIAMAVSAPLAMAEQAANLKTTTGNEIGLTVSQYEYKEPDISLSDKATKFGIDYNGALALSDDWFLRGDLRYATGKVDYSSSTSGTKNGNPDWYYEIRGVAGKDFQAGNYVYSPYVGLGYRYLFNDMRGLSSTGAAGYRRESNYYYMPIGVTHRMSLESQARLATNVEYDYLLRGRQFSQTSDTVGYNGITRATDATNKQSGGYGFRLNVMYETSNWSAGPYLTYWHINQSDTTTVYGTQAGVNYTLLAMEPKNNTTEFGVKASYRF